MSDGENDVDMDTVPAELDSVLLGSEGLKAPEEMDVNLAVESSSQTATERSAASSQALIPAVSTVTASTPSTLSPSGPASPAPYLNTTARVSESPNYSLSIFLCKLAEEISEDVFKKMKFLCQLNGSIPKAKMQHVKDSLDLFTKLHDGGYIKSYDLLMLQSLLWFSGAWESFRAVAEYGAEQMLKPLHLFAPSPRPINGYAHVKFHLRGCSQTHTPEAVSSLRNHVASLMQVPAWFVFIAGVETGSLWITLAVPGCLLDALLQRAKKTPSLLSHWNVLQIVVGDQVLDLEDRPVTVEQMEESSLLDELGRKTRELEAAQEETRQILAGIEAAYHHCCTAAQEWILRPDQECQKLLEGLQELQKSMPGQTDPALHSMVHQLVEANRLLSQSVSLRELFPGAEKSDSRAEKQIEELRNEILKLRLRIAKMRSAKRLRYSTKPGRSYQRRHRVGVLNLSSAVAVRNTRRGSIQSVSTMFMSISVCEVNEDSNSTESDFPAIKIGSNFSSDDTDTADSLNLSGPPVAMDIIQKVKTVNKDPMKRMLKGVCLIFADEKFCMKEVSMIRNYFSACGYHIDLNEEAGLDALPNSLVEPTQAVVVWFIGDILRICLHDIVTKVCSSCKPSQKAVIINQRMDWHQTNFHPKSNNLLVASFAGDTALMSDTPKADSFATRAIRYLENSRPGEGLASSLLRAAHDSNADLACGSFLSFSSLNKDIQLKT